MKTVYFITILLVSVAVSSAAPFSRNDDDKNFVACMSKCLIGGDEHDHLEAVYKTCKDSATCWGEHLGHRVQKCASGCKDPALEEVLVWTAIESSSLVVSDVPEFVKCMAKCLGKSLEEVEKWYEECKKNAKCWMKKVGFQGLKCAGKCVKVDETTAVVASDATETSSLVVSDVPEFVKCMAKCLGKSLEEVEKWYEECKKNAKCWMKKVGFQGLKCAGKCVKVDETTAVVASDDIKKRDDEKDDENIHFLLCMAICLGKDINEIRQWYKECKKSLKCWFKKAGKDALKCAGKCFLLDEKTATSVVETGNKITASSNFTKCLFNCFMGDILTIVGWYKTCGEDMDCWLKKAWKEGMKCATKCGGNEAVSSPAAEKVSVPVPVNNDFLKCMGECLKKDISEILEWYNKCHRDIGCWLKEAGGGALKCAGQCLLAEKDKTDTVLESTYVILAPDNNDFLKCMGHCLGKDVSEILEWYNKCHTDIQCWLKEVGWEGLKCAGKCLAQEETKLNIVPDNNDFLKCMGHCLGKDVSEILEWYNKCHTDIQCWLKEVGIEGLKCAGKCLAEESDSQSDPSQSDLVKFASYEKVIQVFKTSKGPSSSRRL